MLFGSASGYGHWGGVVEGFMDDFKDDFLGFA